MSSTIPLPKRIPLPGAELLLYERVPLGDDRALLAALIRGIDWRQEYITLFGRTHPQPRLVAWYGDPSAHYSYSGIPHEPQPWTPTLQQLRKSVESLCGYHFNSVLLNYYRDGRDSMGLHADDEPELGDQPVIASLSLGEQRSLYFQHRARRDLETFSLALPSSSLLVMAGDTQRNWKHGMRKLSRSCGPRVNLTFRRICC